MVISSLDNFKIKELKKLQNKKYRDIHDKFLVEGLHIVEEAYKTGFLLEVIIEESFDVDIAVPKTKVTKKILKSLSLLESPTNIIGVCKKTEFSKDLGDNILILDNIQDPGNLGSIIRSAFAFNFDLIISEDTTDIYNEKVIRSSKGMIFKQNIIKTNILEKIKELKQNYTIYGTDVNNGMTLNSIENKDKSVIIIGNEGKGISEEVKALCDKHIYIKMNSECESLNAASAASIILYEFSKE